MATPMFIVTGFLDSGKTTMIKDTLMEQEWIEPGLTLLLLCEEGEEEYPEEYLKEKNMAVLKIEEFEQLNTVFFKNCERNYHPAQIVIEYNGMWKLEDLLSIRYPRSFELQGVYSTVNGMTLDMYLMNMRNMLMEQLTESELIVVNRCADGVNRSGFRRALKVQNPMAQLLFEDMQRNKVKYIIDKVDLIHSVDSVRLAETIDKEAEKHNVTANILIEVNVAKEESKFGLMPEEVPAFVEQISKFSHIRVKGLMTIAPFVENPEDNRPVFAHLRKLSVDIAKKNIDNITMSILSMGMTNDYQVAIEEGATMVRVGTGIFGARDYTHQV